MSTDLPTQSYCQSCGMPMNTPKLNGTNADGSSSSEYCTYCFQKGEFTLKVTMEEFIEKQVQIAVNAMGIDAKQARAMANSVLPELKRWKSQV